ncbi:MAG: hypothetical protein ACO3JL_07620 [Myxococcota bacterium]
MWIRWPLLTVASLCFLAGCASAVESSPPHAAAERDEYDVLIATALEGVQAVRQRGEAGKPRDLERETHTLQLFLRAAELRPDRVEAPYGAAVMLVAACQANRLACGELCPPAIALLDRADALQVGYRYSSWNRGICLESTGQFEDALVAAERSLLEYPDDPDMWALRAKVRLSLGYLHGACEDLAQMLTLQGTTDGLERALAPFGCHLEAGRPRYVRHDEPAAVQL